MECSYFIGVCSLLITNTDTNKRKLKRLELRVDRWTPNVEDSYEYSK
jgi:hypothetical protein